MAHKLKSKKLSTAHDEPKAYSLASKRTDIALPFPSDCTRNIVSVDEITIALPITWNNVTLQRAPVQFMTDEKQL